MDLFLVAIGILLVFVGAVFFGFPVGKMFGRREAWEQFLGDRHVLVDLTTNEKHEPTVVAASRARLEQSDVLNADILEGGNQ